MNSIVAKVRRSERLYMIDSVGPRAGTQPNDFIARLPTADPYLQRQLRSWEIENSCDSCQSLADNRRDMSDP
jgi:hypothetical protein